MPTERATLIDNLIDAAEYASEVLGAYADLVDREDGLPTPNRAMLARMKLEQALDIFRLRRKEEEEMVKMGTRF